MASTPAGRLFFSSERWLLCLEDLRGEAERDLSRDRERERSDMVEEEGGKEEELVSVWRREGDSCLLNSDAHQRFGPFYHLGSI